MTSPLTIFGFFVTNIFHFTVGLCSKTCTDDVKMWYEHLRHTRLQSQKAAYFRLAENECISLVTRVQNYNTSKKSKNNK